MPECGWCEEPIDGEYREIPHLPAAGPAEKKQYHPDCAIRMVLGGVNHLKRICTCYGGSQPPDPPGMTEREAATAAAEFLRSSDFRIRD